MKAILLSLAFFLILGSSHAQGTFENPEKLVQALYQEVSFAAGDIPDWEFASSLFIQEAVIILRYGPDNMTVFDVPGWVDDFIAFTEEEEVKKSGFTETILGMNTYIYGDIASINVLFESHIPGTDRKNQGVDIFQLIRKGDSWKIVSIINERPAFGGEVPDIY